MFFLFLYFSLPFFSSCFSLFSPRSLSFSKQVNGLKGKRRERSIAQIKNQTPKILISQKEEMADGSEKKLFDAIEHGDEEVVKEILQTQEIDFNCKDAVISFVNYKKISSFSFLCLILVDFVRVKIPLFIGLLGRV